MLYTTQGIVFHTVSYSDNSVIAKIYTRQFGLQSFMINGVHGKKSNTKASALQPLSILEMVAYHKERKQLQKVKEMKQHITFTSIPYDHSKRAILLFINEVLYKSIREEETNESLFEFIRDSLQILDLAPTTNPNFHLLFMLRLSRYLGFYPQGNYSEQTPYFHLQEGFFCDHEPSTSYFMNKPTASTLSDILKCDYTSIENVHINSQQRKLLLHNLLLYFELHLPSFNNLQSHRVLEEVMA